MGGEVLKFWRRMYIHSLKPSWTPKKPYKEYVLLKRKRKTLPCMLRGAWDLRFKVQLSSSFIWGYYGTHCRVRLHPPFGYTSLYKECNLIAF